MKKVSTYLILMATAFGITSVCNGQTWNTVGAAGFSAGTAVYTSMAIDPAGTPYVVYSDAANGGAATVMKYNGSSWVTVGSAGFSAGTAYDLSIAIDRGGVPYVVYSDNANGLRATVMSYNGSSWVTIGSAGFSANLAQYNSIAINGSGTPYVAYEDGYGGATVMSYNGSSWVTVGSAGFSGVYGVSYTSIAINASDTPYLVYQDGFNSQKATVMQYNGSSWVTVGNAGFSAGVAKYTSIAIDGSGMPYVAYMDFANGEKATVMQYNGSSWVTTGSAGFSAGEAAYTSIAINGSGTPYVVYQDYGSISDGKATVMQYNGSSWVTAGNAGFSAGVVAYTSIAISGSGIPYVVYEDAGNGNGATVMELVTSLPAITGTTTVCVGSSTTLSDVAQGGVWSSSNAGIAVISSPGIVTGVSAGTATISYTLAGDVTACVVTVNPSPSSSFVISTYAGNGTVGYSDGSLATASGLSLPIGIAVDANNNIYISDFWNKLVEKVDAVTGVITTVAGNGTQGFSGDGGPATAAQFFYPGGIAVDNSNNIYINDPQNYRVRKVSPAGIITTIAGTGILGFSGDGGPATAAQISRPYGGVAVDGYGNVYIPDYDNARIRKIDNSGIITTYAGGGSNYGDGEPATDAALGITFGIAIDVSGSLYITDQASSRIRKVDASGIITTIAGNGVTGYSGDGGPATNAEIGNAGFYGTGIGVDRNGNVYLADYDNQVVRKIDNSGIITTIAGNGTQGYAGDGGMPSLAGLNNPISVCSDAVGNIYIGSASDDRINYVRKIGLPGITGTPAVCVGSTAPLTDIVTGGAWSSSNTSIANVDASGNVTGVSAGTANISYLITSGCGNALAATLVTVNPLPTAGIITGPLSIATGSYSTLSDAATGGAWSSNNTAIATVFSTTGTVTGVSVGTAIIAYTASNSCGNAFAVTTVTVISSNCQKIITTYAGTGMYDYGGDSGPATAASFRTPYCVAVDAANNIYIADQGNHRVERIDAVTGIITSIAGTGTEGYSGDGGPATAAQLGEPSAVVVDNSNNIYVAEFVNNVVRKITPSGIITTIAGNGGTGYSGDGGPATDAQIYLPAGITFDGYGNIYIEGSGVVRRVNPGGIITTYAGGGSDLGEGVPATNAYLNNPKGITMDGSGNLFISNTWGSSIRKVNSSGVISTIGGNGVSGYSGDGGPATDAQIGFPYGIAVDGSGSVYFTDYVNWDIRKIDNTGIITTIAGNGIEGFSGDGGIPTAAEFDLPLSVAFDGNGNLFIADASNIRIRKIGIPGIAGTTAVCLGSTTSLSDADNGGSWSSSSATIATVGSTGVVTGVSSGMATITYTLPCGYVVASVTVNPLPTPITGTTSICTGLTNFTTSLSDGISGGIWSSGNTAFATVGSTGVVTGVSSGTAAISYTLSCGVAATTVSVNALNFSAGPNVAVCSGSSTTLSESSGLTAFSWSPAAGLSCTTCAKPAASPTITTTYTLTGTDALGCSSTATTTITVNPLPAAIIANGGGIISTIAGNGSGYSGDGGPATAALFNDLSAPVVDGSGNIYIADANNGRIRKISASGILSTIAGNGTEGFSGDGGTAADAQLNLPSGVAIDGIGNIYIADNYNHRIRKINTSGIISTIAGSGGVGPSAGGYSGDGGPATSGKLNFPTAIAVDGSGNVYIADKLNQRIRKINASGIISTIAGNGTPGFSGDNGPASSAELHNPSCVAVDGSGNIYISDNINSRIRKVNASGIISTISGNGTAGYSGDGGPATSAEINNPYGGIAADATGNIFIADFANNRIRKVSTSGIISTIAGDGIGGFSGDGGPATSAELSTPWGVAVDGKENIYIADSFTRIRIVNAASAICVGSTITLNNVTPGGIWSSGSAAVATVNGLGVVRGVAPGITTINYTVANGCGMATTSAVVTVNPLPTGTISGTANVCAGGTTSLIGTGTGYGGFWIGVTPIASVDSAGIVTGLAPGTATIHYTLSNNCGTFNTTQVVTVNPLPSAGTISGLLVVNTGSTITLTDAASGGTWSVSNTHATVAGGVVTGVTAGTATVSYSVSNTCGIAVATIAITINAVSSAITGTKAVCAGATTTLSDGTSGGTWSSSSAAIATVGAGTGIVKGVSAGTATITYTISASHATTIVTVYPDPSVGVSAGSILCYGGPATVTVSGTGGTGALTGIGTFTVTAGTYNYTVTDARGCTATTSETVTQPVALSLSGTVTNVSCYGGNTGSITTSVTGGTSPYTYSWSTGAASAGLTSRPAGTYSVTVTDHHGCTKASSFAIAQPPALSASISVSPVYCVAGSAPYTIYLGYGPSSVTLSAAASGGTSGYHYSWAPCGGSSASITVSPAVTTTYTVTVTDAHGCTTTNTQAIYVIDIRCSDGKNVYVCHYGANLSCDAGAVPGHLAHGDYCGPCQKKGGRTVNPADTAGNTSGINDAVAEETIKVYPNPNKGTFTMNLVSANEEQVQVTITNIAGQKVKEFTTLTNIPVDVKLNEPPGIYMLSAITANGEYTVKIVFE